MEEHAHPSLCVVHAARALIDAAEALRTSRVQTDRIVSALEGRWARNRASRGSTEAPPTD